MTINISMQDGNDLIDNVKLVIFLLYSEKGKLKNVMLVVLLRHQSEKEAPNIFVHQTVRSSIRQFLKLCV